MANSCAGLARRLLRCRLADLSISLMGKQKLTVELDGDFRKEFDSLKDQDCEISIKKFRNKRSLEANAYAWVLIDKIAAKMRVPKTDVYRNTIKEIGGVSELLSMKTISVDRFCKEWSERGIGWQCEKLESAIPGWTNVLAYYGSSVYDTQQMATLIELLVQEAQALDIETRPQEEINSLLEAYDAEFNRRYGKAHG